MIKLILRSKDLIIPESGLSFDSTAVLEKQLRSLLCACFPNTPVKPKSCAILSGIIKSSLLISLLFAVSQDIFAHAGSHGNNECTINVQNIELRINGYQFQGKHPDRHYCRHFPHLGSTIIKIDSISSDLSQMGIELQLLKRNSWLGLLLGRADAFSVIKKQPIQYFSNQVVSINNDIKSIDIYAINLILHKGSGGKVQQRFIFIVGFPFAQIMVGIASLLLLVIFFIASKNSIKKK